MLCGMCGKDTPLRALDPGQALRCPCGALLRSPAETVEFFHELVCPRCRVPLVESQVGEAMLHRCGQCNGAFARCKAESVLLRKGDEAVAILDEPSGSPSVVADLGGYIRCPCCTMLMRRIQFGRGSGVVIDVCWDHGSWFDNGELSAVIRYAAPRVHKHPQEPTPADLEQEELDGMEKRRRAYELGRSMEDSAPRIAAVAGHSAKDTDTTELPFTVLRYLLGRLW